MTRTPRPGGKMLNRDHENKESPCCRAPVEGREEATDWGDHGGHTVWREEVALACTDCGGDVAAEELVRWDEEVAA